MKSQLRVLFGGIGGAFVALVAVHGIQALAADADTLPDAVERVIPYAGTLEREGRPFSADVDLRFTLFDGAGDGADDLWVEEHSVAAGRPRVPVFAGAFSVRLGQYVDVTDAVFDAEDLYIGVEVRRPGESIWTALEGRQRLTPSPYAFWVPQGADTTIADELSVGGTASIGGGLLLDADMYVASGQVKLGFDGETGAGLAGPHGVAFGDSGGDAGGGQLVYRTDSNQLAFEAGTDFADGSDALTLDADDGSFAASGAATFGAGNDGASTVAGAVSITGGVLRVDPALRFVDGSGIRFGDSGTDGTLQYYNSGALAFRAAEGGSSILTIRESGTVSFADDVEVDGEMRIPTKSWGSAGSTIEGGSLDKTWNDTGCVEGAIRLGQNNGHPSICVCFDDSAHDTGTDDRQGYYCFE